jgi:hypothetical protein
MWRSASVIPLAVAVFISAVSWLNEVAPQQADRTRDVFESGSEKHPSSLEPFYPFLPERHCLLVRKYQIQVVPFEFGTAVRRGTGAKQKQPLPKKRVVQDAALWNVAMLTIVHVLSRGEQFPPDKFQSPHLPNPNLCSSESVPCRTRLSLLPLSQTIEVNFRQMPIPQEFHCSPAMGCPRTRRTIDDA